MSLNQNIGYQLVRDSRLMPSDHVNYEVYEAPRYTSIQTYPVVSSSNSSLNFNIQTPSLQTIINKRMYVNTSIQFVCNLTPAVQPSTNGTTVNPNWPFNWGTSVAPSAYPLQSLISTLQLTINNTTLSQVQSEEIQTILRLMDPSKLQRNSMTPTQLDSVMNYEDALFTNANVLSGYENSQANTLNQPNGAIPLDFLYMSTTGAPGSYVPFDRLSQLSISQLWFQFTVTEDLVLSPLLFGDVKSAYSNGMYGVNTLNWIMNLGLPNRCIRCALQNPVLPATSVSTMSFVLATPTNSSMSGSSAFSSLCNMILEYAAIPSEISLPSKNLHGFFEFPKYITSGFNATPGVTSSLQSSTISLKCIPDYLVFYIRKAWGQQTNYDSDFAMVINNINLTWNSNSGILSSATPTQLYEYTVESQCQESWSQFSGSANLGSFGQPQGSLLPTIGSYLVLAMGKHVQIGSGYAPGQMGQYQLQVNIQYTYQQTLSFQGVNRQSYRTQTIPVELVTLTINSGYLVNDHGNSSLQVGVLDADIIRKTDNQPVSSDFLNRKIGGGFFDTLKNASATILPWVKRALALIPDARAKAISATLESFGYGHKKKKHGGGHPDDYLIDGDYRLRE